MIIPDSDNEIWRRLCSDRKICDSPPPCLQRWYFQLALRWQDPMEDMAVDMALAADMAVAAMALVTASAADMALVEATTSDTRADT